MGRTDAPDVMRPMGRGEEEEERREERSEERWRRWEEERGKERKRDAM